MNRTACIAAALILACGARAWGQDANAQTPRAGGPPGSTSAAPGGLDATIQAALRRALPSVVRVFFGEDEMLTGTIISEDGLVLTCAHLPVDVGGAVRVGLADGRAATAKVLSKLPEPGQSRAGRDLALLQIAEAGPWPAAAVAETSPADDETPLLAVGFPDTLLYGADRSADPLYVRLGRAVRSPYEKLPDQLITTIAGTGGDSGGPLLDLSGRVVGVVHAGDSSGAHMGYTRIEVLRRGWEKLAPGRAAPSAAPELGGAPAVSSVADAARGLRRSVVQIDSNSRWIGLGCVVGDGLILTKASELGPNLTVLLDGGYVAIAEAAATDPERDLALLRLTYAPELTKGIEAVRWEAGGEAPAGTPVVLATPDALSPAVGVACFAARPVPRIPGMIPCEMEQGPDGVRVKRIVEEIRKYRLRPPALPLRAGDTITHVEGSPVADLPAFARLAFDVEKIGRHPRASGEPIQVTYRRDGQPTEARVVLEFDRTPSGQLVRPASNRYSSFPLALATDLAVRPEHCGGPVVDSHGRVVGLLIARAPFIESLVIPSGEIAESLKAMMAAAKAKP